MEENKQTMCTVEEMYNKMKSLMRDDQGSKTIFATLEIKNAKEIINVNKIDYEIRITVG